VAAAPRARRQHDRPAADRWSLRSAAKRYVETRTQPIELSVTADPMRPRRRARGAPRAAGRHGRRRQRAGGADSAPSACAARRRARAGGVVPARARFTTTLVVPPLAFAALRFVGRWRERLSRDVQRNQAERAGPARFAGRAAAAAWGAAGIHLARRARPPRSTVTRSSACVRETCPSALGRAGWPALRLDELGRGCLRRARPGGTRTPTPWSRSLETLRTRRGFAPGGDSRRARGRHGQGHGRGGG
jgi:hypothetical protein